MNGFHIDLSALLPARKPHRVTIRRRGMLRPPYEVTLSCCCGAKRHVPAGIAQLEEVTVMQPKPRHEGAVVFKAVRMSPKDEWNRLHKNCGVAP